MKRFILSIALSLLVLTISAQIQCSFFGCTLGVSTKAFVKNAMIRRGYHLVVKNNKYIYYDVKFGGFECDKVVLSFFSGKLFRVDIHINNQNGDKSLADQEYKKLHSLLDAKYSNYKIEDECNYQEPYWELFCNYKDEKTSVSLQFPEHYETWVVMTYLDLELNRLRLKYISDIL